MTARLAEIYRHPLKAIGREALSAVSLSAGEALPWDRAFAIAHDRARAEDLSASWAHKMNYLRGVTGPDLMAVTCAFAEQPMRLTLRHPRLAELSVDLTSATDQAALIAWVKQIWPNDAAAPVRVIHHPNTAQTDVPKPWIAINSLTAHRMVSQKLDAPDLSVHRWRGNLWIQGLGPWEEFEWVGRNIRIGEVTLKVEQRITRCKATMANPETGRRDLDTLGALEAGWGHTDFGVYAEVTEGGRITLGDVVEVLS